MQREPGSLPRLAHFAGAPGLRHSEQAVKVVLSGALQPHLAVGPLEATSPSGFWNNVS